MLKPQAFDHFAHEMRLRTRGIPFAIAVVAVLTFLPAVLYDFVCWDDEHNFTWNPDFGALTWARVGWAWTTFRTEVYQPFAWIFLEAQASLWGMDARGYHATSLVLHAINSVVLYRLTIVLLDRCGEKEGLPERRDRAVAAGLATLLFAAHPLRVEVVAWASCQPYLPSVLCSMFAVLAYLRAHPKEGATSRPRLAASWCWFVAALLFKAEAATLPALLVILDAYPLRRIGPGRWRDRGVWLEKAPFFAPSLVILGVAARARGVIGPGVAANPFDLSTHLAQASYSAGFYLAKTAWPTRLSIFYGMPERINLTAWPFWFAALAVVLLSVGAALTCRRWPGVSAAWLAYLVILSLHLGLVQTGPVIAADRYSYFATMPLAVLLAGALARALAAGRFVRSMVMVGCSVIGLALVVATWEQCRQWRTSEVLLRTALADGGRRSPEVRSALALALKRAGKLPEAESLCREALAMEPDYFQAHYNLALILGEQGRNAEAEGHFAAASRIVPDDRDAQFNLANALARQGKAGEAIAHYRKALEIEPFADAAFNLAILLAEQGRYAEAADAYRLAVKLRPDHAPTHNNLGVILGELGDYRGAEAQFLETLRLQPNHPKARKSLEFIRQRLGQH